MSLVIELDDQTAKVVQELAAKENRPPTDVIQDALAAYAGKRKRPLPRGVGKYSSGQPDLAQRDEELLRGAVEKS